MKLRGIGLPGFGIAWHERDRPPASMELAERWGDVIQFAIDTLGPARCMFESNFPFERPAFGYDVLWNAFKRMSASHTAEERRRLFLDSASRADRIGGCEGATSVRSPRDTS